MKKINKIKYHLMLAGALILGLASCKKDIEHGVLVGSKGTPTISNIRTVSKSTVDSSRTSTYHYIKANGKDSVVVLQNLNPVVTAFDSTTVTGRIGNYYAVMGEHLGSATTITLNGVNVLFNRALSSDNTILFAIPSTVPVVQPQSNDLVITTLYGSVTYKFTTLPPPPTISAVSEYNFTAGSKITLKGQGFLAVNGIKLTTGGAVVNYTAQGDTILTLTMPATTATQSTLLFSYTSAAAAGKALQTASSTSFVSIDNNYKLFANGALQNTWYDASWAAPSGPVATAPSIMSGKGSFLLTYPAGGWQIEGFGNNTGIAYDPAYRFLSFWVKGGVADHTLVIVGDAVKGGDNQVQNANAYAAQLVKAPKNVWTYYKIPLTHNATASTTTSLNLWETSNTAKTIRFFLQGMSGDVTESMYVDEVMLVK